MINKYEIESFSSEISDIYNNRISFYKDIAIFAEEREIDRLDNLKFIVYSNDHFPPHFHVITLNGETEYIYEINKDWEIENIKIEKGDDKRKIRRSVKNWYYKFNGKNKFKDEWERTKSR